MNISIRRPTAVAVAEACLDRMQCRKHNSKSAKQHPYRPWAFTSLWAPGDKQSEELLATVSARSGK